MNILSALMIGVLSLATPHDEIADGTTVGEILNLAPVNATNAAEDVVAAYDATNLTPRIAAKYTKPNGGIPMTDIAPSMQSIIYGKQDALVSGSNIKTVNGNSLLGSGNLVVEGMSGETATNITVDVLNKKFGLTTNQSGNFIYHKDKYEVIYNKFRFVGDEGGELQFIADDDVIGRVYTYYEGGNHIYMKGPFEFVSTSNPEKISKVKADGTDIATLSTATNIAQNVVREDVRMNYLCTVETARGMTNGLVSKSWVSNNKQDRFVTKSPLVINKRNYQWLLNESPVCYTKSFGAEEGWAADAYADPWCTELYLGGGCTVEVPIGEPSKYRIYQSGAGWISDYLTDTPDMVGDELSINATTLSGYGITDAYTKTQIDGTTVTNGGAKAYADANFINASKTPGMSIVTEKVVFGGGADFGEDVNITSGKKLNLTSNGRNSSFFGYAFKYEDDNFETRDVSLPNKSGTIALTSDILQSDWTETNATSKAYIQNKPTIPSTYLKSATSTATSLTVTKQDDTTVGLEVQYDYALTNLTGAAVSLASGQIGNVTLGAGTNTLSLALNFDAAEDRSGDCLLYLVNPTDTTLSILPLETVTPVGIDLSQAVKAGTNLVMATRMKREGNKSVVLISKKEIK